MNLSAVVIAKDEEKNIGECLDGLSFCDERILVDSGSCDRTAEIAEKKGAKVFRHDFKDFADQKNYGISMAAGEWVLLVDADERVSEALASEITRILKKPSVNGYVLPRKNRIFGRWMRFGSSRQDGQLRLVKRSMAYFEGAVHEKIRLRGPAGKLKNPLLHYSAETVSARCKKLNHYTSLEARMMGDGPKGVCVKSMKARPLAVLLHRIFWQGAVLDGLEGFIFSFFNAYYEFIRRAKHWELKDNESKIS